LFGDEFLDTFVADFSDVNGAVFVDRDAVGHLELAGPGSFRAEAVENLALEGHDEDFIGSAVGDEKAIVGSDVHSEGSKAAEEADEFSVLVEDLDAVVLAVADVDESFGIDPDRVGKIKLGFAGAFFAPGEFEFSVSIGADDAGVAVAISDEDVTVLCKGDVGGLVEVACIGSFDIAFAEGEKRFAGGAEFDDGVVFVVGCPDRALRIAAQTVGGVEEVGAEGANEFSGGCQHEDRCLAAVEDDEIALAVHFNAGGGAEFEVGRELGEAGNGCVGGFSRGEDSHGCREGDQWMEENA